MALGKIPYLGSDLENALTNEYVAKMNEIRMEQLTRVGVLSMLENPTPDELKEFRNQLKWIILGWTMTPGSPISTLNDEAMKEVAEVLVNLRKTYADLHRKPIKRLVDKLLLSGPQTSYVTNKLDFFFFKGSLHAKLFHLSMNVQRVMKRR
ncbi:hypothetical protein D915_000185 [Fasciola hepatica]|uniref:Uncharacterized protein n=1 Tax=Fasciola hepatica TaxID=6192 RepID=A0A4E0S3I9_FASHE|nr:hypothetical protein D915_000185 [Fasciola hepatica]